MEENKAVTATTPATLLDMAVQNGADVEKLEKLMELKMRWDANEARKSFNASMVKAQAEMPIVPKDKKNNQTNSMYSAYETILKHTKEIYTREGFSIMFYEGKADEEKEVRVMADILHRDGHSETRYVDIPKDLAGIKGTINKTPTHAKGSSISYGRGYLIRMIFNIPTGSDDDGNQASGFEYLEEKQVITLNNLLKGLSGGEQRKEKFLKYMNVEKVEEILAKDFKKALTTLSQAR